MSKNGNLSAAGKQAARAVNGLSSLGTSKQNSEGDAIRSLGTSRQFQQIFTSAAEFANARGQRLSNLTAEVANEYLKQRSGDIQQKQLNTETRALEMHLRNVSGDSSQSLQRQASELSTIKDSRAYSPEQTKYLADQQSPRMALSTEICAAAGLRAHELNTLQKMNTPESRKPSTHRTWSNEMYSGGGRENWESYTVEGKGGLVREIRMPEQLSQRLEATRLTAPEKVRDRGINYLTQYKITAGQAFSNAWSKSSNTHLGFSNGVHGLRHLYAQQRMREIQNSGIPYPSALALVSQELGHFRSDITLEYLR